MNAILPGGTKMKTADQGVTAPLIPLVGDAKTVTSSEVPTFREPTWSVSEVKAPPPPPHPPLRPEWGAVGLSNDWCINSK